MIKKLTIVLAVIAIINTHTVTEEEQHLYDELKGRMEKNGYNLRNQLTSPEAMVKYRKSLLEAELYCKAKRTVTDLGTSFEQ